LKQAVLLLAHGAPERVEDLPEYLQNVRGGRETPPQILAEIRQRYEAIGGGSPLTARTRDQAAALERELGIPVRFAMRNWHPSIRETLEGMRAGGVERIVALCLAPQYSKSSVGLYFRRTQEAKVALGYAAEMVWAKTFHAHPLLIEAFYERLKLLLPEQGRDRQGAGPSQVLFTAHSLPERALERADPYDVEARTTARLVAERAGIAGWDFAYQNQGFTGEKWLGPTVESKLDEYASAGVREVVLVPIGFVSDHVEILYNVDVVFRNYARERGIELRRTESLNDSPTFIRALAAVVRERLCPGA